MTSTLRQCTCTCTHNVDKLCIDLHSTCTHMPYLGVRPPSEFVHLNVVRVRSLLSPPGGASTNPLRRPMYSVKATVTSSTALPELLIRSRKCVRLTFSCLMVGRRQDHNGFSLSLSLSQIRH